MALDTSTRAISSRTMAASTSPMPMPPYSSPTVTVNSSARRRASSDASANSSVSSQPGRVGGDVALGHVAGQLAQGGPVLVLDEVDRAHAGPSPPARPRAGGGGHRT